MHTPGHMLGKEVPKTKRQEFKAKVFLGIVVIVLLFLVVGIDTCMNDAEKVADKIQQTKDDGKIVEIDGLKWKRITFYDEDDRCWKIYTYEDSTHAKSVFAVECKKE